MTKGTKIAIGVLATLAVGGLVTWLVVRSRKPQEDQEWEDADIEGGKTKDGVGGTTRTPISPEQRKANNFASVKAYFGKSVANYGNRIIYKTTANQLEKKIGWLKTYKDEDGNTKTTRTRTLGLSGSTPISVVYWEDGHFTVKIGDIKAAVQGYYYNGGRVVKVTKGKGIFASKAGLRETDDARLLAIGRIFKR